MRNLRISKYEENGNETNLPITASAFDTSNASIVYAVGPTEDRPIIELKRKKSSFAQDPVQIDHESAKSTTITSWDAPCPLPELKCDEILLLQYFSDISTICLVLAGGDVVVVREKPTLDQEKIEIVGSVDAGILAAAWAPDQELLVIVTRADTLLLMSRTFEPVNETTLTPEDLKASKHVSVGWGKKETQFQGKGAKALRDPTMPETVDEGKPSPLEDGKVTVSWRGDGAYFAVNSIMQSHRRVIRVFSREAVLDSASEPVDGLESALSWRPYGNLIASVRRSEKLEVVFFERNGLRHGQFDLRLSHAEMEAWASNLSLCWNTDSTVLAVTFADRIQLWTMGNYHYYLKQELLMTQADFHQPRLVWHSEIPLELVVHTPTTLIDIELASKITRGSTLPPHDYGIVAVIDGETLKLTPFRSAGVPPPSAFCEIECSAPITDCAISATSQLIAVLTQHNIDLCNWEMHPATTRSGEDKPLLKHSTNVNRRSILLPSGQSSRRCTQIEVVENSAYVFGFKEGHARLWKLDLEQTEIRFEDITMNAGLKEVGARNVQNIVTDSVQSSIWVQDSHQTTLIRPDGLHHSLPGSSPNSAIFSPVIDIHAQSNGYTDPVYHKISLIRGILQADERVLARDCTSFAVTEAHLLFTTSQHLLKFAHLVPPATMEVPGDTPEVDERCRSIERGARIVTVMPSIYAVVLQMPRGNIETTYPRVLVLSGIRKHIASLDYRAAFLACQTHQVDMNIIHDYRPDLFMANVSLFLDKLKKPSRIDEFISKLKDEDVTVTLYKDTLNISDQAPPAQPNKVNSICDALIANLQDRSNSYLQNIITAHVCKRPPSLVQALSLISKLRLTSSTDADLAVSHLCFLTDTTRLYDAALSLYDLNLALLVAQNAQRDPKEYMPFLQSLHALPDLRRKYTIDNHLKNYTSALTHLHALVAHDEVESYTIKHSLYSTALNLYSSTPPHHDRITRLYASHLSTTNPSHAAMLYESLSIYDLAYPLYAKTNSWRESLSCAALVPLPPSQLSALATQLAHSLTELRDFRSAAHIHTDYLASPTTAATLLCKGSYFAEALRILSLDPALHSQITMIIDGGLGEKVGELLEFLADCRGQLAAQVPRIRELRVKKESDPLGFFGGDNMLAGDGEGDVSLRDDISLAATDASTAGGASMFTRYGDGKSRFGGTVATGGGMGGSVGTVGTGVSRKTSKTKRKEERKRARGKKGSVYEEEYLVKSVARLVDRVNGMMGEVERLREGLGRRGMRDFGRRVEEGMQEIEGECRRAVENIWGTIEDGDGQGEAGEVVSGRPNGADGVLWDTLQGEEEVKRPEVKTWKKTEIFSI